MTLITFGGATPSVPSSAWVAPTATLIGSVTLGEAASVFYGAVVRADSAPISLGAGSNLQDNVVVHVDEGQPCIIGDGVSVGHAAVLHGCTIGNDCLIGMNATVLNRSVIGAESLIAAGALILEGTVIPPGSLVAGVPGRVRRSLTDDERAHLRRNATHYVELSAEHRAANEPQGGR